LLDRLARDWQLDKVPRIAALAPEVPNPAPARNPSPLAGKADEKLQTGVVSPSIPPDLTS